MIPRPCWLKRWEIKSAAELVSGRNASAPAKICATLTLSLFLLLCFFSQKQLHFRCDASGGASVLLAKPNLFIKCRKIFIFSVGWVRDEREGAQNSTSSGQIERTRRRRSRWYMTCRPVEPRDTLHPSLRVEFIPRSQSLDRSSPASHSAISAFVHAVCSPIQSQPRFAFKNLDQSTVSRGQGTCLFFRPSGWNCEFSFERERRENACVVGAHATCWRWLILSL